MPVIKFNPFYEYGILNYDQYKKYPFLISSSLKILKNRITEQINSEYMFAERLILLGEKGIGKTSALFFIQDLLKENNNCNVVFVSRLFEDFEHFDLISGKRLFELSQKPTYILIDFPDTINANQYKKFLSCLWDIFQHKNYNNINLIFSMNVSHYDKSFSYSEILGKFMNLRFERFNEDETKELIKKRLQIAEGDMSIFEDSVLDTIYSYSKGIPRNIVSASSILISDLISEKKDKINYQTAKEILKDKYIDQVINDRVTDSGLKDIYKWMVKILEEDFGGVVQSQEDYVKKIEASIGISRATILKRISDLCKFGIVSFQKGGYNRLSKIISLN